MKWVWFIILAGLAFISTQLDFSSFGAKLAEVDGLPSGFVDRVIDGDTIEVRIGQQLYKVRYIGIDTPETVDPRRPVGYFGEQASAKNKELVLYKTVYLERDVSDTDKYGRLLRYVYLSDKTMVNLELVRLGYAKASTYPPDVKFSMLFADAEREARNNGRGLWAEAN
jgi:micrococcal nuclease